MPAQAAELQAAQQGLSQLVSVQQRQKPRELTGPVPFRAIFCEIPTRERSSELHEWGGQVAELPQSCWQSAAHLKLW